MKKLCLVVVFVFFQIIVLHGQVSGNFPTATGGSGLWNEFHAGVTDNGNLRISSIDEHLPDRVLIEKNHTYNPAYDQQKLAEVHTNSNSTSSNESARNLDSVLTQPTKSINKINEDFPDTIKIGSRFDYPTLTGAGGLFIALNNKKPVTKNLLVIIKDDLTEDGTNAIKDWTKSSGPFTITIHPDGKRKMSFPGNNGISLDGTIGLVIDGLDDGLNSLSLEKSAGIAGSCVLEIKNGASNNTITRTTLTGYNSYNSAFVITIYNSSININSDNTISYCTISSFATSPVANATYRGILLTGNKSTSNNTIIDHNTFKNFSNSAIHQENGTFTNTTISNNEIFNTVAVGSGDNYKGINLTGYLGTCNIFNNKIYDIKCSSGTSTTEGISAIYCSTSVNDVLSIHNNVISIDINGTQTGLGINGIKLNNIGKVNLNYNTIGIGGSVVNSKNSYCIYNENNGELNNSNNIIYNVRSNSSGNGKHYGIYNKGNIISDHNDLFVTGNGGYVGYQTTDRKSLTDWQTTGHDVNSIGVDPKFTSTTNFVPLNSALNIGIPIPGITKDINGALRDVSSPTVGAYEIPCNNPVSPGSVAADQVIWDNDLPAMITSIAPASGYSGNAEYKWQSSVSPFNSWTDLPESNALTFQSGRIAETTLFKRIARSDCKKTWTGAVESNAVTITYNTNKWKGTYDSDWGNPLNWTRNVVPDEETDIYFDDQSIQSCQLDQDRIVKNVFIHAGAQLIIPVEKMLQVKEKIINQAGAYGLVIQASLTGETANGSLIFHNDPALDPVVQATVEMFTKASRVNGTYRWQFFGIPVKSILANPTFSGSYVREMHENVIGTTGHWVQLDNNSLLTSFTGYEITQDSEKIIRFEGDLENRNFNSMELSYTPDATYKGEHLIANPYTAAIAIRNYDTPANALTFGEGMDKTVYLYNTGSKTDWSVNTINGGGNNDAPGQYLSIPQEYAGSDLPSSIPSMQAFLVMVNTPGTNATVSIPYSSTGTIVKNTTSQRAPGIERVYTRIDVAGSNSGDRMWIFTDPRCTSGFDNGWDGYKLMGSALMPQIYASEPDADYQVSSRNDMNDTYLGFVAGMDTTYTLTFTHHNITSRYREIYLLDLIENKTMNVTANKSQYTFLAKTDPTVEKRFKIIATPADWRLFTDLQTKSKPGSLVVFNTRKTIIVNNQSDQNGKLNIYDVLGRNVGKMQFASNVITTFLVDLPTGLYWSKAETSNFETTNYLLIIE